MSIAVAGASVHYGSRLALSEATIEARAGEVLGLLGPNGAGKTTTLRMCTGFLRMDAGTVRVAGHDLAKEPDLARRALGVCTQDDTLDPDFPVRAGLEQTARYYRPRIHDLQPRIELSPEVMEKARVPLERMLEMAGRTVGQGDVGKPIIDQPEKIDPTISGD